eukprot:c19275_g1_i1 orf=444-2027(-)
MKMDTAVAMDVDALDLSALPSDASHFSSTLGVPSDADTDRFLSRYPLPVLFSVLEGGDDLKSLMIPTLEKIFNTHAGAAALLQSLPYAVNGLEASSPAIKRMTCLAISKLLEHFGDNEATLRALVSSNLPVLVLDAVTDRDESVASAGMETIQNLAKTSIGIDLLFTGKEATAAHLKELVFHGSSLVRIRIFSIIASLVRYSQQAVMAIQESGILKVLELELSNGNDVLAQMNALELVHEIAVTPDGAKFVSDGGLLQQLISIIESSEVDALVRSRSMMVGARLISPEGSLPSLVSKKDAMKIVTVLDSYLRTLESFQSREKEAVIDALGWIGMSKVGAELLLEGSSPIAKHVVEAAFTRKGGSEQLVGIHALASIVGSERTEGPLLSNQAELSLKDLIFSELEISSKPSVSELIQWLLQQAYELRLAVYRLIVPSAARSWFLIDICSSKELVKFLTDPYTEKSKEGMEWRHACCVAISTSLGTSVNSIHSRLHEVLEKFQAAVTRGPYFGREKLEAQPLVATEDRF